MGGGGGFGEDFDAHVAGVDAAVAVGHLVAEAGAAGKAGGGVNSRLPSGFQLRLPARPVVSTPLTARASPSASVSPVRRPGAGRLRLPLRHTWSTSSSATGAVLVTSMTTCAVSLPPKPSATV
jgi:hypothetical protein